MGAEADIARFVWSDHALLRLGQRRLATFEVEQAIRNITRRVDRTTVEPTG